MPDWTSLNYAVVDVEGNGQHPPDLVELAVVPIVAGRIGQPTSWLVRPPQPITRFAARIHGITSTAVADAPTVGDIAPEVLHHLHGRVLVAHNAHIDVDVLTRSLPGWQPREVFDTLKLARRLHPSQGSYKLGALVEAFDLAADMPDGLRPHRATYDTLVTARLFTRLAEHAGSIAALRGSTAREHEPVALF